MAIQMPDQQVAELRTHVQDLLDQECRDRKVDFRLIVQEEAFQEGDWVTLIALPDRKEVSATDYAIILTLAETRLRRDEHVKNVALLPALPG